IFRDSTMRITMVKKRLADGQPCKKCVQAEEMLTRRGLLTHIDEVVWVEENDETSPGACLAREFRVDVAPCFVVHPQDRDPVLHTNVTTFTKWLAAQLATTTTRPRLERIDPQALQFLATELDQASPEKILGLGLERFGARLGIAFSGAEDVV